MSQLSQIRQRIRQILTERNASINRVAAGDSSLQRKLNRQITEDVSLSVDTIIALQRALPGLNAQWLITGEGEPFPENSGDSRKTTESDPLRVRLTDAESVVPVYSVEASANLNTLNLSSREPDIIGRIAVPNMPRCDGATYVRGDSMYPLLQSGDIIGFKVMPTSVDSIFFGEIYLVTLDVEGDRYLTVKYIYRSELGPEYVKLVSANPDHQPKEIHLSAIRSLALVKFTIRFNSML